MTTDADVIIAGAGPAGSLAAYELALKGVSVLILEKSVFPRYKVCGAGLTYKILQQIPFDISPVLETQIHTIVFSSGFRQRFTRSSDEPMLFCTNRDKFDDFLLKKAVEAGARVIHGEIVMQVTQDDEFVTIVTRSGTFHSKLVIGADGASSAVARSAGLRENMLPGLAWEAEVTADPATVKAFSQTIFLDWGFFPGGYGWVFPKGDHFSIGVGGPASLSKSMMPYYQKLLEYLANCQLQTANCQLPTADCQLPTANCQLQTADCQLPTANCPLKITSTMSLKSWPIPGRIKKSRFHNKRVLVAGDAAGLTDPLTGEGIYYAVRSGILAAKSCHAYLQASHPSLESYTRSVNDELMTELLEANRIKNLFNTVPLKIHRFVRDNDRAWRAFIKILRGERWYADVPAGFGRWKFFWGAACYISKWISEMKEKRFRNR
ncbi:MAG: NAD(P)/FAD-dependent oxidoreductase [Bacteroidetes bacterium]|nr:NAD(P)/FAD-dependent oxidoreductase [Bacteroidota bacterium]